MTEITIPEGATIQQSNRVVYGTATGTGPFVIPFPFFDEGDIQVYDDGVLQTLNTHYTVSGVAVDGGYSSGSITMVSSVTTSELIIVRSLVVERLADFLSSGPFPMATLNLTLDKMTAILQQLRTNLDRSLRLPDSEVTLTAVLPDLDDRKGKYLTFDATTGAPATVSVIDEASITVTPFAESLLDDTSSAEAQATLGFLGRKTIWVPAIIISPRVSLPPAVLATVETTSGNPDITALGFSVADYAQFSIAMPDSWDKGDITAQFYWTSTSGTGTVTWSLSGFSVPDDDSIDLAGFSGATVTDTVTSNEDLQVTDETPAISISTPENDDIVFFQVGRTGGTHSAASLLIGIKIYYDVDAPNDD